MASFLKAVYRRERDQGVLSISPVHGYMMANIVDMGSKMLVITDNDIGLARKTAEQLGMKFYEARGQLAQAENMDAVLDKVQKRVINGEKAIQLVEWSDIGGAGFPTDGTEVLQALFNRGMTNVAAGLMWDPLAVSISHDAGEGAELNMRIGGKATPLSGIPLDLKVIVERSYRNLMISTRVGDVVAGDAVVLRCGDTELLLVSNQIMGYGSQAFIDMGIDISSKDYLLLKLLA